jgi:secreted trypsin-like serine protease
MGFDGLRHFTASTTSGSASLMSFLTRASVSSRQSRSFLIRAIDQRAGGVDAFFCAHGGLSATALGRSGYRHKNAGLGACTGDSGARGYMATPSGLAVIGAASWSTDPNGEAGCGGLTGVTPIELYRGWIVAQAKAMGSAL